MVSPDAPIVKATKATDVTEGRATRNFGLRRWSPLGWDRTGETAPSAGATAARRGVATVTHRMALTVEVM